MHNLRNKSIMKQLCEHNITLVYIHRRLRFIIIIIKLDRYCDYLHSPCKNKYRIIATKLKKLLCCIEGFKYTSLL